MQFRIQIKSLVDYCLQADCNFVIFVYFSLSKEPLKVDHNVSPTGTVLA